MLPSKIIRNGTLRRSTFRVFSVCVLCVHSLCSVCSAYPFRAPYALLSAGSGKLLAIGGSSGAPSLRSYFLLATLYSLRVLVSWWSTLSLSAFLTPSLYSLHAPYTVSSLLSACSSRDWSPGDDGK